MTNDIDYSFAGMSEVVQSMTFLLSVTNFPPDIGILW